MFHCSNASRLALVATATATTALSNVIVNLSLAPKTESAGMFEATTLEMAGAVAKDPLMTGLATPLRDGHTVESASTLRIGEATVNVNCPIRGGRAPVASIMVISNVVADNHVPT